MSFYQWIRLFFLLFNLIFSAVSDPAPLPGGTIYLYGEEHLNEEDYAAELAAWDEFYHERGMRDLFIETSYFAAEYLNLWMREEDDAMLDRLYRDWQGTVHHSPAVLEFFLSIKKDYPETVFHGVDVGHQYESTGKRYLAYLDSIGTDHNAEEYRQTLLAIRQGKRFYEGPPPHDGRYREFKLAENLAECYEQLGRPNAMGIFGYAHVNPEGIYMYKSLKRNMAQILRDRYRLNTEILNPRKELSDPGEFLLETKTIAGQDYKARYLGRRFWGNNSRSIRYCDYWLIEDAFEDFRNAPVTGSYLPYYNFPAQVEEQEIYLVECVKADGSVVSGVYRADAYHLNDFLIAQEIDPEK